jgi:hypothetical protein
LALELRDELREQIAGHLWGTSLGVGMVIAGDDGGVG